VETFSGGCHCGNIRYRFIWPLDQAEIPVRACSCTFCTKHGGTYTSHADARLDVVIADATLLTKYRFGTETADFYVCKTCGAVPIIISTIDGHDYAVVNVNTFENIEASRFKRTVSRFDGETTDNRLDRRKRNWIGDVTIAVTNA
jgi:hypothetical protein